MASNDLEAAPLELNPHMRQRSTTAYACPYGECGGEGFVLDEETNVARPCRCRAQRIAHSRSRRLRREIPEKYRDVAFDRNPVPEILESLPSTYSGRFRRFCREIERKLDAGEGMWFIGPPGTGKTTLAMLISVHAMRARRAVAIYTAPQLMDHLMAARKSDRSDDFMDLSQRLQQVDLLHLEDLAAQPPNEWVHQTFYSVINDRYQEGRSVIFTADVAAPPQLADFLGQRTYSRLMEMCGDPIPLFGSDHRISRLRGRDV